MDKKGKLLFDPAWGIYDLAVGERIVSVFCGAADKAAFETLPLRPAAKIKPITSDTKTTALQQPYQQVRDCRQKQKGYPILDTVWESLQKDHPGDWLCALEILEILAEQNIKIAMAAGIKLYLKQKMKAEPPLEKLITDGLGLIDQYF